MKLLTTIKQKMLFYVIEIFLMETAT